MLLAAVLAAGCGFYTRLELADFAAGGEPPRLEYLLLVSTLGDTRAASVHLRERDIVSGTDATALRQSTKLSREWRYAGIFSGRVQQACVAPDGRSLVVFYADNVRLYEPDEQAARTSDIFPAERRRILLLPPKNGRILAGTVFRALSRPAPDSSLRGTAMDYLAAVVAAGEETALITRPIDGRAADTRRMVLAGFPEEPARTCVVISDCETGGAGGQKSEPSRPGLRAPQAFVCVLSRAPEAQLLVYALEALLPAAPVPAGAAEPLDNLPAAFRGEMAGLPSVRHFSVLPAAGGILLLLRYQDEGSRLQLWAGGAAGWRLAETLSPPWPRFIFDFGIFDLHAAGGRPPTETFGGSLQLYATNTQTVAVLEKSDDGDWRRLGNVETGVKRLVEATFLMLLAAAAFLLITGLLLAWQAMRGHAPLAAVIAQRARLPARAAAFMFDMAIVLAGLQLAAYLSSPAEETPLSDVTATDLLAFFLLHHGFTVFYFVLSESVLGRTPGKMLLGLRVVQADGQPAGRLRLLVRNLLRFIDFLPPFVLPFVPASTLPLFGGLAILLTRQRQRPGDILAGTFVVQRSPATEKEQPTVSRREQIQTASRPPAHAGAAWPPSAPTGGDLQPSTPDSPATSKDTGHRPQAPGPDSQPSAADNCADDVAGLVLASASRRRAELLRQNGYRFRVLVPELVEPPPEPAEKPWGYAMRLACLKQSDIRARHWLPEGTIVLSADTLVAGGDEARDILGKPADAEDARRMLKTLVRKPHRVITGLCLSKIPDRDYLTAWDATEVVLEMSEQDIDAYIASGKWRNRAGAYSIEKQDRFAKLSDGTRSNAEGLPIELFQQMYARLVIGNDSDE